MFGGKKRKLMNAVKANDGDSVAALIAGGGIDDAYIAEAMKTAVSQRRNVAVNAMLKAGVSPDTKLDDAGSTAMRYAIINGDAQVAKILLEHGATPRNTGFEPDLPHAVRQGRTEIALALLQAGADADATDGDGKPPLSFALEHGLDGMAKALLEAGADVNAADGSNATPLVYATWRNRVDVDVIKDLLDRGADPNVADDEGDTALICAARHAEKEIIELLIARGADVNAQNRIGRTALIALADENEDAAFACIATLLKAGADPNLQDEDDDTALHYAVARANAKLAALLLDHKADPDLRGEDGETALILAAREEDHDMVELLLGRGADPDIASDDDETALGIAVCEEDKKTARALVAAGADTDEMRLEAEDEGDEDTIEFLDAVQRAGDKKAAKKYGGFVMEDDHTVWREDTLKGGRLKLTKVFNFNDREVTTVANDKGGVGATVRRFEDVSATLLQQAAEALKAQGGTVPDGALREVFKLKSTGVSLDPAPVTHPPKSNKRRAKARKHG